MFNDEQVNSPKLIRKRSSSLDSKAVTKYRENNYFLIKNQEKQMKKYASSSSLINYESNVNRSKKNTNFDGYFLFVNWYKDFRSVKQTLLSLHNPNIFKTDFWQNDINSKNNTIYLIMHNFKIDNEYEAFLINDYIARLNELLTWARENNDKELIRQLELMQKQTGCEHWSSETTSENDNEQEADEVKVKTTRNTETMALIIQNKNQPMTSFTPREIQGQMNTLQYACELEIYYLNQDKKGEKNFKSVPRIGMLSNQDINIFTKNLKLKDSYTLKHIYLGECSESQIANINSCLRIGGPFGNDMIIRFQSPLARNEWYDYIEKKISEYQETIKSSTSSITIFNDTNPSSSAPLVSKSLTIHGTTNGSSLKIMAMNIFEIKDIDIKDLLIVFLLKNKENILHDDVSPLVLQEHANNIQENSCVKSCMHCDRGTVAVKIIYYLRSNRPVNNDNLGKGVVPTKKTYPIKSKPNKYNINARWNENEMPKWLMTLLADLYNEGAKCEGIFRLTGSVTQSDDYVNQIAETDDLKIDTHIHNKTNILKKFISIIDGSLLTTITKENFNNLTNEIISTDDFLLQDGLQARLINLIQTIPPNHLNFFQHILVILDSIIKNSQINQMNISNVSTCFSQNLFKHLSDDPIKINRLFECILHVRNRIVNPITYNNIIRSFEYRKPSIGSGESHFKLDGMINTDLESNSPTFYRTVSDSNEEKKSVSDKPIVPPRRKKTNHRTRTTQITPDESPAVFTRSISRQMSLKDKRQSSSVTLPIDSNDRNLDEIDSKFISRNLDEPILPSKSPARLNQKSKKLSRSSNTFSSTSPEVIKNPESSNFCRQNQVNRKHNKNNSNIENINQTQTNAKNNVNQIKTNSKLTRSADRVISKTRSRSQSKLGENVPNISQTKFTYHYNPSNIQNIDDSRKMQMERKRSSSACRVPKLKEQYESIQQNPRPPLPTKKHSFIGENQKVNKMIKNFEPNKTNEISRNHGPIRPSHNVQNKNTQDVYEYSRPSTLSHASNRLSLQDKLNDSNDDDVTYI